MDRDRKIIFLLTAIVLVVSLLLVLKSSPTLTSGTIFKQIQCVDPQTALQLINDQGCERVYEDGACAEKGLVEISCL